jgi:hypothetical protein
MVGDRTDHHPLVMQSWLRKRRTICRAKPSRIQPPGRFVCGRRSPGRRVWTPVGRGDPPHGAATRIATLTGPRSFSLLRRGNAQCITQPNGRHQQRGDGGGVCPRYKRERYEHDQAVRDGSAWICSAVRQCIGPTARHPNQPAAAPITITATTKRHPDCSAIRPAPASTTAIISIHNLHSELRYAGHELPECVCPRRTWRRQSVLQSDLQQPTTGVQAILRFGAVVSAPGASASRPVVNPPQSHPQTPQAPNPAPRPDRDREADNSPQPIPGLSRPPPPGRYPHIHRTALLRIPPKASFGRRHRIANPRAGLARGDQTAWLGW